MADENVTIIKKKKVSGGHGHHGGAWKVAYADFVTAMMAFFLLMWLLNATTEKQRKGLADYFSPTIPVHSTSGGGDGPFSGSSVFATMELPQVGVGATETASEAAQDDEGQTGVAENDDTAENTAPSTEAGRVASTQESEFELLQGMLLASSGESDLENELLQHIRTRLTDEGLIIEIFDRSGRPLFEAGSDTPTPDLLAILGVIGKVAATVTNELAISGHSYVSGGRSEGLNWQLSVNRAERARALMAETGIGANRIARVSGMADRKQAFEDRGDIRNNRLEITLLR